MAAAAQAWAIILGVLVGVPFVGVAVWQAMRSDFQIAAAWLANGMMGFVFFYATFYLPATYRTSQDFAKLATVTVMQNAVGLVLVVAVVLCGFYGVCLRAAVPVLFGAWMLRRWQPIRVGPHWSLAQLRHLLIIGLPIFAVGELGSTLWMLIDQRLVQHYMDARGLGLYSPVLMVAGTMEFLPLAFSQVIYPRMSQQYGRTHDVGKIIHMAIRPCLMLTACMAPLAVLGWWLAPQLASSLLLGRYDDAIPAMQWGLLPAGPEFVSGIQRLQRRAAAGPLRHRAGSLAFPAISPA